MERTVFTPENVANLLNALASSDQAKIFQDSTEKPFKVQEIFVDLGTKRPEADPYAINVPFKSLYVQEATDTFATVDVRLGSNDSFQSKFRLRQNDVWVSQYPNAKAFLSWEAQPNKTMRIVLFVDSEFRSGSQISVTGGGVSIKTGSTQLQTPQNLAAATTLSLLPNDPTRSYGLIQNISGSPIWVGAAGVTNAGASRGIEVPNLATFQWSNTAELFGYSVSGGVVLVHEEH